MMRFLPHMSSCSASRCNEFLEVRLHSMWFCGSFASVPARFWKAAAEGRDRGRVAGRDGGRESTGERCMHTRGLQVFSPQKGSAPFFDPWEQSQALSQQPLGGRLEITPYPPSHCVKGHSDLHSTLEELRSAWCH